MEELILGIVVRPSTVEMIYEALCEHVKAGAYASSAISGDDRDGPIVLNEKPFRLLEVSSGTLVLSISHKDGVIMVPNAHEDEEYPTIDVYDTGAFVFRLGQINGVEWGTMFEPTGEE